MARKLRIQYPGAIYHVMNRGDRREPIFKRLHPIFRPARTGAGGPERSGFEGGGPGGDAERFGEETGGGDAAEGGDNGAAEMDCGPPADGIPDVSEQSALLAAPRKLKPTTNGIKVIKLGTDPF